MQVVRERRRGSLAKLACGSRGNFLHLRLGEADYLLLVGLLYSKRRSNPVEDKTERPPEGRDSPIMMSRTMREAHCDPTWRVAHQFRREIEIVRACLRSADSSGGSNSGSDEGEAEIGSLVLSLRLSTRHVFGTLASVVARTFHKRYVHVTDHLRSFSSRRHTE